MLTTAAKVQIVLDVLQRLYPSPSIPLKSRDPYTHLIAVLLSAQCTDARVNQVTPALFARADRPERMVELAVEEIEQIIHPCGLAPRKSQGYLDALANTARRTRWPSPARSGRTRTPAWSGAQDRTSRSGPEFRCADLSRGHPHPSADLPLGGVQRQERRANGTGLQAPLSPGALERPAPANYLLWPRALPSARAPAGRVPFVQ